MFISVRMSLLCGAIWSKVFVAVRRPSSLVYSECSVSFCCMTAMLRAGLFYSECSVVCCCMMAMLRAGLVYSEQSVSCCCMTISFVRVLSTASVMFLVAV